MSKSRPAIHGPWSTTGTVTDLFGPEILTGVPQAMSLMAVNIRVRETAWAPEESQQTAGGVHAYQLANVSTSPAVLAGAVPSAAGFAFLIVACGWESRAVAAGCGPGMLGGRLGTAVGAWLAGGVTGTAPPCASGKGGAWATSGVGWEPWALASTRTRGPMNSTTAA
jgi:hypothetical protein